GLDGARSGLCGSRLRRRVRGRNAPAPPAPALGDATSGSGSSSTTASGITGWKSQSRTAGFGFGFGSMSSSDRLLHAVIVDDERLARRALKALLASERDVVIVGGAGSLHQATTARRRVGKAVGPIHGA